MNNVTFGLTPDEIEDDAKHFCAVGTVSLRAIADDISEIALKGEGISLLELQLLHVRLKNVYQLIGGQTVFGMDNDGTPVAVVVGPPSSRGWSAPGDVYDCGIPWLPITINNDDYDEDGPIPPGCEVMVVDPPHQRKLKTRAVCQEAYGDPEALIARVREARR